MANELAPSAEPVATGKSVVPPSPGEVITSLATGTTYTMGDQIGEGYFGVVFECADGWDNNLAAKVLKPTRPYEEYGPFDHRIDIYHLGLLFLQLAHSKEFKFTREEILAGRPREIALELAPPLNFALEKALRRHVAFRTGGAMELWRDLHSPPGVTPESASAA